MSVYETITLLISTIALIISATALFRSRKVSEKQLELEKITADLSQKKLEKIQNDEIASAKAMIDAEFKKIGDGYRFIVKNVGQSTATNISFGFSGHGYPLVPNDYASKHPITELRPGKSIEYLTSLNMSSAREYMFDFLWHNPDGSQSKDEIVCTW